MAAPTLSAAAPTGELEPQYPNAEQLMARDVDLEKNVYTDVVEALDPSLSEKDFAHKAEVVELTPLEALRANVDGDQSPFPEVAACVSNTDDPTIACNTVRAWILITVFVMLFSGVNTFFGLRYPSLTIGYVVAQLLVFPVGRAWQQLPRWRVPLGRFTFDVNPGKFTIKEHALIVICVNLTAASPYGLGAAVATISPVYWNRDFGAGWLFLFFFSSQGLGFGLAGLARRWLVYPGALTWPSSLASTVLFRALHEPQDRSPANGWTISRYRFFIYVTAFAFVLYWFPDYIWTTTSSFAFITWIVPSNQKVNTIFGMSSGLGLLPLSIDWTQITYAGLPLTTPFYITCNAFAVVAIFFLFLSPILYYSNVWESAYSTFDFTGATYNVSKVVDSNYDFVLSKYEAYSPMYIALSYSLSYALSFAAVTALVVHTYLYNRHEIWARLKNASHGGEDIHRRLMRAYKEVPDWWYAVLTVVVLGLGILTTSYWDTGLPWWGFIVFCFGWCVILLVPEGILEGTTNQRIFLNIITELVAGYVFQGKAIANMMVKIFGYNSVKHGMDFSMDQKLGQYMKIPPRVLFVGQIYSTLLASMVQTGVLRWMIGNIKNLCSSTNTDKFTCNGAKVVYNASLIWGTIGPQRLFQAGQTYNATMYFFIIGQVLADCNADSRPVVTVLVWLVYRRYPQSWLRYINVPIFFNAAGNIPPASTTQYSLWFIVGFLFNYLIRKRAFAWWKRYNYLTSAAMDTGTALATIIIFFCLSYTGVKLSWWGNTVGANTADRLATPWLSLTGTNQTHFGKGVGEF